MGDFWANYGWKIVTVLILLDLFGWGYCWLVYAYAPRKKIKHRTAEFVVLGVFITIVGTGCAIGWSNQVTGFDAVVIMFLCFIATGGPMVVGYWVVDSHNDSQDEEDARKLVDEKIKKAKELNRHAE